MAEVLSSGRYWLTWVCPTSEWPTDVAPDQPLDQALAALETSAATAVPVLEHEGNIVGWLDAEALLAVLQGPPAPRAAK